jgi:hypothetical protein
VHAGKDRYDKFLIGYPYKFDSVVWMLLMEDKLKNGNTMKADLSKRVRNDLNVLCVESMVMG